MSLADKRVESILGRAGKFYAEAGAKIAGSLKCERCGHVTACPAEKASEHLRSGWPRHCGYTMSLVR